MRTALKDAADKCVRRPTQVSRLQSQYELLLSRVGPPDAAAPPVGAAPVASPTCSRHSTGSAPPPADSLPAAEGLVDGERPARHSCEMYRVHGCRRVVFASGTADGLLFGARLGATQRRARQPPAGVPPARRPQQRRRPRHHLGGPRRGSGSATPTRCWRTRRRRCSARRATRWWLR